MKQPEAFSRILIDKALEEGGWNLLDPHEVRFELGGSNGRADYILLGKNGPLCVLEAKKPELDPYDAKEQARGYAENLKAPFIILSNGREHWFWNYERADKRDALWSKNKKSFLRKHGYSPRQAGKGRANRA